MDVDDHKKWQRFDKFENKDEKEDIGYVLLPFIALPPSLKESNRPTDISKGTKSLNYLVCIPIIGLSYNC